LEEEIGIEKGIQGLELVTLEVDEVFASDFDSWNNLGR
jgi:hypothetical protein